MSLREERQYEELVENLQQALTSMASGNRGLALFKNLCRILERDDEEEEFHFVVQTFVFALALFESAVKSKNFSCCGLAVLQHCFFPYGCVSFVS